ncbi:MAG: patatin-like phospholipase family protein [Anaerolineae bacterium]|nr:patatin-like phospholipase family protein [Anaerolineae bacterium]
MTRYRILSLDGGGIKGIVTAIAMQRLTRTTGIEDWLSQVDLIAGTSTGGLLALAIAYGLDLQSIRELYERQGPAVFADTWLDDVRDLGKLVGADYDIAVLERELARIFGDATLGDLAKRVLITSFDLDNEGAGGHARTWKPKLFHNYPGEDSDAEALVRRVGLYTAAAPTYFSTVDGYVDGGVYATNPSMCALAQAQDARFRERPALDEVVLLSLGTGASLTYISGKRLNWGYVQWARPLVTLMLEGSAGIADFQCRQMLGQRYHRLAPVYPAGVSVPMDAVDQIPYLVRFAQELDLDATARWIQEEWV